MKHVKPNEINEFVGGGRPRSAGGEPALDGAGGPGFYLMVWAGVCLISVGAWWLNKRYGFIVDALLVAAGLLLVVVLNLLWHRIEEEGRRR